MVNINNGFANNFNDFIHDGLQRKMIEILQKTRHFGVRTIPLFASNYHHLQSHTYHVLCVQQYSILD